MDLKFYFLKIYRNQMDYSNHWFSSFLVNSNPLSRKSQQVQIC